MVTYLPSHRCRERPGHARGIVPSSSTNTRILAIDDDPSITSLLKRGLTYEGYQVSTASSAKEGLDLALWRRPDLVILDLRMPCMDGIEACRRLRSLDRGLPILILTADDTASDQVQAFEAGADDYVVKPFTFEVLIARVKALLRRAGPQAAEVLRLADLTLDTGTRSARRGDREIDLTSTEYDLLLQFLRQPRRVIPKEQLLDKVWGYDFEGNFNVLEVYIRYLRAKLETRGEPRLIHTVRGAGYLLREPRADETAIGN